MLEFCNICGAQVQANGPTFLYSIVVPAEVAQANPKALRPNATICEDCYVKYNDAPVSA